MRREVSRLQERWASQAWSARRRSKIPSMTFWGWMLSRDPGDRRSLPTPELMFYRSQLVATQVPPAWVQMLADDIMAPDDLGFC